MEFVPRDCEQLADPTDGCGWKVEALVGYDLSSSESLVVTMSCEKGKNFYLALDTKKGVSERLGPWGQKIECSGQREDYKLELKNLETLFGGTGSFEASGVTRLRVHYEDAQESTAEFSLTGITVE